MNREKTLVVTQGGGGNSKIWQLARYLTGKEAKESNITRLYEKDTLQQKLYKDTNQGIRVETLNYIF